MHLNPKLKWHLTAQNVNRIQQAAVQILLRTVLLSQMTSKNLKQEISYSRKFVFFTFSSRIRPKPHLTRFFAQYFQFVIHEHLYTLCCIMCVANDSVWVGDFFVDVKKRTQIDDVWEQGSDKKI